MPDFRAPILTLAIALATGTVLAACTTPAPSGSRTNPGSSPSTPAVRTDREPLTKRFPLLGEFAEAHWQGWPASSPDVPGPTDVIIQALVVLSKEDLASVKARYAWQPPPMGADVKVNEALLPFTPAAANWQYNADFERHVKTTAYGGMVRLDLSTGTVFLHVSSS